MAVSGLELVRSLERRIADDKAAHLRGWARVRLSHLAFPNSIRQEDKKITAQLARNIDAHGCHDEKHPIPAIIDDDILQAALSQASVQPDSLKKAPSKNSPKLRLPRETKLECLDGLHRTLAAKQTLRLAERWWTIELYGTGLGNDARESLRDGYSYSANYTDGEIFRYIRECQLAGDGLGEDRWRSHYSPTKERDLKQLLKRKILLTALDSIRPVRGLWGDFHVGSLDIFLTSRFDEEISHYIGCIWGVFNEIFDGDTSLMELTDEPTVEAIRLRAPAISSYDAEFIQSQMRQKRLFYKIQDPSVREGITSRLLAIEQPILTIYTLFKDLRYLQPALGLIRELIPKKLNTTLCEALDSHFLPAEYADGSLEVQVSECSYSTFSGSSGQFFDLAARQLFLYAIRRFAKPLADRVHVYSTFGLAELAEKLGFSSSEIDSILKNDPYQRMVLDLIRGILPSQKVADIQMRTQPITKELRELVDALSTPPGERLAPWATVAGLGEPLSRRCGPAVWAPPDDVKEGESGDLSHMFLKQMHTPLAELQRGGEGISSFYVKQSIYLAFFGTPSLGEHSYARLSNSQQTHGYTTPSISQTARLADQPAATDSGDGGLDPDSHDSSQDLATNRVVPFGGRMITFIENGVPIRELPYEKDGVNFQAREYADQGKKLHVPEGAHFVWEHCFDILARTRSSTVLVSTVIQPTSRKRRRNQNIPGQFPVSRDIETGDEDNDII